MSGRRGFLTMLGGAGLGLTLARHIVFDPGLFKVAPKAGDLSLDALFARIEAETFRRFPDAKWLPVGALGTDQQLVTFLLPVGSEANVQKCYVEPVADLLSTHLRGNEAPLSYQRDGSRLRGWYRYDERKDEHWCSVVVGQVFA